jgi:hypothetical protein
VGQAVHSSLMRRRRESRAAGVALADDGKDTRYGEIDWWLVTVE